MRRPIFRFGAPDRSPEREARGAWLGDSVLVVLDGHGASASASPGRTSPPPALTVVPLPDLLDALSDLEPAARLELLEQVLSVAAPKLEEPGGFSLAKDLHLLRDALRERLPRPGTEADQPQSMQIDEVLAVDASSFWIKGWVTDRDGTLDRLVAFSPEGCPVNLLEGSVRVARPDLAEHHLGASIDSDARKGFLKFVELPVPSRLEQGWLVELHSATGSGLESEGPSVVSHLESVRDRILAEFTTEPPREELRRDHAYPALARLQRRLRKSARIESVTSYGSPEAQADVSIIVPLYQRLDLIQHQLASFALDPEIASADLIYVLDSPELAAELAAIAAQCAELYQVPFRVACLNGNAGYAIANNLGASVAKGRVLLLLNSDVFPAGPGWLSAMTSFYDATASVGALGPELLYEDGSIQHAGMYFQRETGTGLWGNQHYFKGFHRDFGEAGISRPVPAVTGACMMIASDLYGEVGGLSDLYVRGGYEDSDLCIRLAERGLENWYLGNLHLYHLEAQSYLHEDLRAPATRYNMWLHTHLWGEQIERLMGEYEQAAAPMQPLIQPLSSPPPSL